MSKDITTSGPSRRSIAKGAAWAVPAISVAAAAPSLAASDLPVCAAGTALDITVESCDIVGLLQPTTYFRVTNPADSGCTLPMGVPLTLATSGVAGIDVAGLTLINADVLFTSTGAATTQKALAPGEYVDVRVITAGINVSLLGRWTLSTPGSAPASFTQTANVSLSGEAIASICATL
ncbi:hypothetical protein [Janibacter limosus]|uniref:DUF4232 domain-containing protein n=1 Tax=Janibacter limosus TaxID=53458 RepID=A0A4P6MV99_9MICO|nr:hypothetical protein [Janibacter limosus]QBF46929.1 hypothetical protein EXU32_12110 [Janibacter limosus]